MIEQLKNKFEEKYQAWKSYGKFIEQNNQDLVKKQEDFSRRVQNLETKEQVEEYFQLQVEPSKHINDISILSNNLFELYKLLENEDFPQEVREEMEKITPLKTYYIAKDDKLHEVNQELHEQLKTRFYQNIETMLKK